MAKKYVHKNKINKHLLRLFVAVIMFVMLFVIYFVTRQKSSTKPVSVAIDRDIYGTPNVQTLKPRWGDSVVRPVNTNRIYTNEKYNFKTIIPAGCAYKEYDYENGDPSLIILPLENDEIWEGNTYKLDGIYLLASKSTQEGHDLMDSEDEFTYWYNNENAEKKTVDVYDANFRTDMIRKSVTLIGGAKAVNYVETANSADGRIYKTGVWFRKSGINYYIEIISENEQDSIKYLPTYQEIISGFSFIK